MIRFTFLLLLPLILTSCAGRLASVATSPATLAFTGSSHQDLVSLPQPARKIPISVYAFRDQTGQYKPLNNVTSFSTAVTQGATSMLIQALADSQWFVPVEREGLQDLLTERKIIRSALDAGGANGKPEKSPQLPPLGFAEIILEGGITAYESNVMTGGLGAKYFGAGGSIEYRVDRVTLYLRAVDVGTGRILKTVSTTKSILSRGVDVGLFRFVRFKRLLELETGLTTNEPAQMCVLDALEKAVTALILEGVLDRLWALKSPDDLKSPIFTRHIQETGRPAPAIYPETKAGAPS